METSLRVIPAAPARRCGACHGALLGRRLAACRCGVVLHPECARGLQRCPTAGCGRRSPRAPRPGLPRDVRGWLLATAAIHVLLGICTAALLTPPAPPRKVWPSPGLYRGPMRCTVFVPSQGEPPAYEHRPHVCRCPCRCEERRPQVASSPPPPCSPPSSR